LSLHTISENYSDKRPLPFIILLCTEPT